MRAGPGGGGQSGPDPPTSAATTQGSVLPDAPKMKRGRAGRASWLMPALGCCVLHTLLLVLGFLPLLRPQGGLKG